MADEIELKLALGPTGPDALRRHPLLAGRAPDTRHLGNTYFDTPRGDLEAARMALRLRRVDGRLLQTLKTRGQGGGGLSTRGEWEWEVSGLDLEGLAALPPMATLTPDTLARLVPRFATDFVREAWGLETADGRIEMALDIGEIRAGERRVAIRELELELKEGTPAALLALATTLAEHVPLRPSDTSKAARGGALLAGRWTLPGGSTPSAWLHRAQVALDALADTGDPAWRDEARQAFLGLAEASDAGVGADARRLAEALCAPDWLTPAFGSLALSLTHRLPGDVALS